MQDELSLITTSAADLPWDLPPPPQAPPAAEEPFKAPTFSNKVVSHIKQLEATSSHPFVQTRSAVSDFGEVNLALEALPLDLPPPPQRPPILSAANASAIDASACCARKHADLGRPCRQPVNAAWESPANLHAQDWEQKAREFFNPSFALEEKPELQSVDPGLPKLPKLGWGDGIECLADPSPLSQSSHQTNGLESKIFGEWQLQAREALINETLNDITFVQESYAAAERDLEWRKATTASKRQQIETRQAELAVFQKRVQTQEKDVVTDEELVRCREAQLDADAQHLRRCENALKAEAKRVKQRRDDLDNSEPMLQRKEEELVRMQEELSKLEKEVSEAEQEIQHRTADIAAAEAQLRRRRAELSSRHAEVAGDRRALNTREAEILHQNSRAPEHATSANANGASLPQASTVAAATPSAASVPPSQALAPVQAPPQPCHAPMMQPCPAPQAPIMMAPPVAPAPAMPADPVQQNLALQLQQTQQMLQMQQMQQLQHFMKAGFTGPETESVKERERDKLEALEAAVLERLENLERHEAALTAVMAAAAQAAKETQEATAAIVSKSTEAAKETAAAIMAKSSEVVRGAVQDMTEALAAREQEALQAMSAKLPPQSQKATRPDEEALTAPKPGRMSAACNTEELLYAAEGMRLTDEGPLSQAHVEEPGEQYDLRMEPSQKLPRDTLKGLGTYTDQLRSMSRGAQSHTPWARTMGARRRALRDGYGIEETEAVASAAALLRGEQPQLGGVQDGGELWCGDSDVSAQTDEQVPAEPVSYFEGSNVVLEEQVVSRTSIVQRSAPELEEEEDIEESEPASPSMSTYSAAKQPPIAWEISLNDWPRTPTQKPQGETLADLGRKRMHKAQEAAKRKVEGPPKARGGPTSSKKTTTAAHIPSATAKAAARRDPRLSSQAQIMKPPTYSPSPTS